MTVVPIHQFCQFWWKEVCKKVKKAVVFIDNHASECLHWSGGIMELLNAGAVAVKEFSSFECGLDSQKKAVFITCSPVHGVTKTILQDIVQASSFEYCVLITAAHPSVQQFCRYGAPREGASEMAAFHSLEEELLQWMGNMNYTVEVFYFPIFLVQVMESLFLTPPFAAIFPIVDCDLSYIKQRYQSLHRVGGLHALDSLSSVELSALSQEVQVGARHLVSCLHSLLAQWDLREDIYSLGPFSGMLAALLEALPAATARRRTAGKRCSLILVDRTLDLATCTSHDSETLLDSILGVLPRLPGHCNDVAVDMSPLCTAQAKSVTENAVIPPGCLSHPDEQCLEVLEWLVGRRQKDVLAGLHQRLAAVAPAGRDEVPGTKLASRVTPVSLEKQVAAFRSHPDKMARCSGLLQQTLAVTQTLRSARLTELSGIVGVEKLLLQNLATVRDGSAVLTQLTQLVRTRHERGLSLDDVLSLLVHTFSLAGSDVAFPKQGLARLELELELEQAFQLDNHLLSHTVSYNPTVSSDMNRSVAARVVDKLRSAADARKDFIKYRHNGSDEVESSSLLQQLVTDILDPDRPELCDLSCKSTGLKELIKTGFSMLLNLPRQQHPLDNPLIVLFVVGGVTAREVRQVQEAVKASGQTAQVLLGSTRLLSPANLTHMIASSVLSSCTEAPVMTAVLRTITQLNSS